MSFDAIVIGAGFGGMYMLYYLREKGYSVLCVERNPSVGGTWYQNRYPGARCDIECLHYSYSFDENLQQEWNWTEKYATQPEILRYANHVADRFELRKDIRFDTTVEKAEWKEDIKRWEITTSNGEVLDSQFLITATGCLSQKKLPDVAGIESFKGKIYHTNDWPKEGVNFEGMRVGVIGTGSSGIQTIPLVAEQAKMLTVFQRTANFSLPALNRPLNPGEQETIKENYKKVREENRNSSFGVSFEFPTKTVLEASEEERSQVFEAGWNSGLLVGVLGTYADVVLNKESNDIVAEFLRQKIRSIVRDPEVAESLCPKNYPIGTKRLCLDTNYYETFNRENVKLVDLRKSPIVNIRDQTIQLNGADEIEVDALILATGFDALVGSITAIDIRGKNNCSLREKWSKSANSFMGLCVSGFPNLFTITGPTSPSVLTNMIASIEQHVEWIGKAIELMRERNAQTCEATVEAEEAWMAHHNAVANFTLYPLADSWYMGANVPDKPRMLYVYCGGLDAYTKMCNEVFVNDFKGLLVA